MAYYAKHTDSMDIYIADGRGTILIKQKWGYNWLNTLDVPAWTDAEKKDFHKKIVSLIWNNWGAGFKLKVRGTSAFAKKHSKTCWDVNFDIEWVLHSEHWKVNVTKYPNNHIENPTGSISWNSKSIDLDTKDTFWEKRVRGVKNYFQYPLVHEFGNAVENSISARDMHSNKYKSSSNHYLDKNSLMNIGNELKDRHLEYILPHLNTMISNSTFSNY